MTFCAPRRNPCLDRTYTVAYSGVLTSPLRHVPGVRIPECFVVHWQAESRAPYHYHRLHTTPHIFCFERQTLGTWVRVGSARSFEYVLIPCHNYYSRSSQTTGNCCSCQLCTQGAAVHQPRHSTYTWFASSHSFFRFRHTVRTSSATPAKSIVYQVFDICIHSKVLTLRKHWFC